MYFPFIYLGPTPPSSPSRVARCYILGAQLFFGVRFIADFSDCLDTRKFAAMGLSRDALPVLGEQHGCKRDTSVVAWSKLWLHWTGCSVSELICYVSNTDSTYVC